MSLSRLGAPLVGLGCVFVTTAAHADLRGPEPDVTPPEVEITSPSDGEQAMADDRIVVEVEAVDPPPEASGVASIQLLVDGEPRLLNEEEPWSFAIGLDPGPHTLRAVARDWEGNEATSDPVTITVEGEALTSSEDVQEQGCGCTSGGGAGWCSTLGFLMVVPWLRRRRRPSRGAPCSER